jgi:addiction module HigA family antidote
MTRRQKARFEKAGWTVGSADDLLGPTRPKNRPPTPPGELLLEEYLKPRGVTQVALAARMGVPIQRVNTIVNGKRGISAETAILLAEALDTTPEFWMGLQADFHLWLALRARAATGQRRVLRVDVRPGTAERRGTRRCARRSGSRPWAGRGGRRNRTGRVGQSSRPLARNHGPDRYQVR